MSLAWDPFLAHGTPIRVLSSISQAGRLIDASLSFYLKIFGGSLSLSKLNLSRVILSHFPLFI